MSVVNVTQVGSKFGLLARDVVKEKNCSAHAHAKSSLDITLDSMVNSNMLGSGTGARDHD